MESSTRSRALGANVLRLYAFKTFSEFWLVAPILIPFYLSNGLNATEVFLIQASYAFGIVVFEVPSGYLADVIGRRRTLILGACFLPAGIALYACGHSFPTFLIAECIIALGNSMRSGCESALIYDSLIELNDVSRYQRIEGRAAVYTRIGTAIAAVAGGLLAGRALRLPFWVNFAVTLPMLPLALGLIEPARHTPPAQNPLRNILRIVRMGLAHRRLRTLMACSALMMAAQLTSIWSYFLLYEHWAISVSWFGVLFCLFQLSGALGSALSQRMVSRWGENCVLWSILLQGVIWLALGLYPSPFLLPLIMLNALLWNSINPILLDQQNRLIASEVRATLLSVSGMAGSLIFVILSPSIGRTIDRYSLSAAFIALSIFFLVAQGILIFLLTRPNADQQPAIAPVV